MVELLILKSGDDYIRIEGDRYRKCRLDKASVFPLEQSEKVMTHLTELKQNHFAEAAVFRLILEEKPYEENIGFIDEGRVV